MKGKEVLAETLSVAEGSFDTLKVPYCGGSHLVRVFFRGWGPFFGPLKSSLSGRREGLSPAAWNRLVRGG
jgi:hypothetical protein